MANMKMLLIIIFSTILTVNASLAGEKINKQDEKDKVSYSIGYQVGGDFRQQGIDILPEMLVRGIQDAMAEAEPLMTVEEMRTTLIDLQHQVSQADTEKMLEEGKKNLEEGQAFLEKNSKKEGVVTLPSGLQYMILTPGTGVSPAASDTVEVHYRGTLIDGTEFDSSYRRGKPAQFRVDGVIAGWTEALQLMKTGGKWRLFIPPELAYGSRKIGNIGPNSTLIFEVELLSVEEDKTARQAQ